MNPIPKEKKRVIRPERFSKRIGRTLCREFPELGLSAEPKWDEIRVTGTLEAPGSSVSAFFSAHISGTGAACFRFVLNRASDQPTAFRALNDFNRSNDFFRAYLREDSYLVIEYGAECADAAAIEACLISVLMRWRECVVSPEYSRLIGIFAH